MSIKNTAAGDIVNITTYDSNGTITGISTGNVTASGNVQGAYLLGNGSQLTNVAANSSSYTTSIIAGLSGSMPYQSAPSVTTFLTIANANAVMTSSGTAPQWSTSLNLDGNVTVNGTGSISKPNNPGFRVYGSSNGNITTTTNVDGTINGTNWTVDYNVGSYLNSTTGTFTAPIAGKYVVTQNGRNSGYTGGISQIVTVKNASLPSSSVIIMTEWAANSTMNHAGGGSIVNMNVGDTLNLMCVAGVIQFDVNDNWSVAFLG